MKIVQIQREVVLEPCSLEMFTYQIDPYAGCAHHCVYCYTQNACPVDWKNEVGVIPGLADKLEAGLEGIQPQTVYMGMNTDPYQPVEKRLGQTRAVLELLGGRGFSVCVLTKSDLVLRDADLLAGMPGSSAGFSVAFARDDLRKMFEPEAPPVESRIEALAGLKRAGVETYALINPVVPFVSEVGALLDLLGPHADTIWIYPLTMASPEDPNWLAARAVLERGFPEALAEIERAAFNRDYTYWQNLREELLSAAPGLPCDLEIRL